MVKIQVNLFLMLCISLASGQSSFWDPVPDQRSTRPAVYNQERTNLISSRVQGADSVGIFFVGNSITHFWEDDGRSVWDQYYGDKYPINAGISGDRTQGVLYRFLNGNLDFKPGVHPKVAVVMIGTNNIGWDPADTPDEAVDGIRAVLQLMIRRMPYTRILLLGVFPRGGGNGNGNYMDQISQINDQLEGFADDEIIHYLDIGEIFLNNNGSVNTSVMPDRLHPNGQGYSLWAEAMDPKLNELLDMDPLRPLRIMPLGNSITEGTSTSQTYRFHLDGMLRRAGYDFDFVGSLKRHENNSKDPDSYEFDIDHEGHWARKADWLLPRIKGYAEADNPDMVLLHIGTNDINHEGGSTPEEVTDRTLSEIGSIIDTLREVNPNVTVFLAKIIPTTGNDIPNPNDVIEMLNSKMDDFAANSSTVDSRIFLVDQYTGFNTRTDMTDPYHPNQAGAIKMAERWLEVIEEKTDSSGVVPVNQARHSIRAVGNLKRVLFWDGSLAVDRFLCQGCSRADVYDMSGRLIFRVHEGRTSPVAVSHRGLVIVDSY